MVRDNNKTVVLHTRVVSGVGGGPEKTILNSPRFLENSQYSAVCAYMHPPSDPGFSELQERASACSAGLISVPDRGPMDFDVVRRLLRICRRENVGIWHAHDYKSNALGLVLRQFRRMHLVTTVHGWVKHTSRTPLYYGIDRLCLRHYEKVICVSDDLYRECRSNGVRANRCVVIENAIDTAEWRRRSTSAQAKKALGISPQSFLIGAVGRLSEEKRFDLLIRAVDQLIRRKLDLELVIFGEGQEKDKLNRLIAELGQSARMHLLGYRRDLRSCYEAMDAFCLSSVREGLPNVLLEAMALAVPVVATRIAGIPSLIQNGKNGVLVQRDSADTLAEGLASLFGNPELQQQFANAGRQTIERSYSFDIRMKKMAQIYDDVTQCRTSKAARCG